MRAPRFTFAAVAPDAGLANTAAEARYAYDTAGHAVAADGLSFRDILKTRFFFARRSDFAEMDSVRDPLFRTEFDAGDFPASTGMVTGGHADTRPFFELEVIAHSDKRVLFAPGVIRQWSGFTPPFSHATVAGGVVFASGQSPYTETGELAATDPIGQAAVVLGAMGKVMSAAGCGNGALLYLTVFVSPAVLPVLGQLREQIDSFVAQTGSQHGPMVSIVPVAQLFRPDMDLAMDFYARAPGGTSTPSVTVGSAQAVRHESFLIATANMRGSGSTASCFQTAAADLTGALSEIGATVADLGLVTVWYSRDLDRAELDSHVRHVFGAAMPVTFAPTAEPQTVLLIEALGNAPSSTPDERAA
jgi:enamine deaminase RidA (YjgF/YER057c/UK114 family)